MIKVSNSISEKIAEHYSECNLNAENKIIKGSDYISEYYFCTKCNKKIIRVE